MQKNTLAALAAVVVGMGLFSSMKKSDTHPHPQASATQTVPKKPNIIFILVDDMGYGDASCYGQKMFSTPNIDKLAQQGMRFTQHYAGSTVCAPSRAALMTGKHVGNCSVRGNAPAGQLLLDEEVTLAELLKKNGYTTAAIGKWGIGHPPPLNDPARNGFDHFYGYINMWHAHNFFPEFLYKDGQKVTQPGNKLQMIDGKNPWAASPEGAGIPEKRVTYAPNEFEKDALQFIESNKSKPFFLYLALNIPHANNEGLTDGMDVPDFGEFASKDWPKQEKGFASMMRRLDNIVGSTMAKLKALGIDERTIVIFASDNGPHEEGGHKGEFFDSNGVLRGFKRDMYEGGVRVPMIVRWKGKIKAGSTSDHVSAFWDVLPTFCDIVGAKTPVGIDGISFLPTLLGKPTQQRKHPYLYWEFYEMGGRQGLRHQNWKGIRLNVRSGLDQSTFELYNLSTDLSETKNVAAQHPDIVKKLEAMMQEAHHSFKYADLFKNDVNADTPH